MDDELSAAERQMIEILREWAKRAASDERSRKRGATWRRRGREKKRRWPRARLTINDASAARKRTMPRVPPIIDSRQKIVD